MSPMRLHLTFIIEDPVPAEDLDDLGNLVREAIDEKIGETEYMVAEVKGYDISFELFD